MRSEDTGRFVDIDPDGWTYGDEIEFDVKADPIRLAGNVMSSAARVPDSLGAQNIDSLAVKPKLPEMGETRLALTIGHSDAFPYSNLWLEAKYVTGDTIVCDTFNIRMADSFGRWYGKGMGVDYQLCDTVTTSYRIKGDTKLHIRHVMRVENLPEIFRIGLTILQPEDKTKR